MFFLDTYISEVQIPRLKTSKKTIRYTLMLVINVFLFLCHKFPMWLLSERYCSCATHSTVRGGGNSEIFQG